MRQLFACLAVLVAVGPLLAQTNIATERQRKQIYNEVIKAQDRAAREARTKYPPKLGSAPKTAQQQQNDGRRDTLAKERTTRYVLAVRKRWGLTRTQLEKIVREGVDKRWPVPRL